MAEPRQRAARGRVVESGPGDLIRAEELRLPAQPLRAREPDEAPEGVARPLVGRRTRGVVGEGIAVAEGAAGEDQGHGPIEGRQQPFDVGGRTEVAGAGIAVGGQDALAERLERGELVGGEEPTTRGGVDPTKPRERKSEGEKDRADPLHELASSEEHTRST